MGFRRSSLLAAGLCSAVSLLAAAAPLAAQKLTSPKEHFGFNIGDDYHLTTYKQTEAYFKKLAAESNRLKLVDIGRTEEGRTQYMMVISSPENIKNLARYKEIAQKLARAEGLTDAQAKALAAEGKAVVWIDGGLHSTETVGTHQLIETIWQFAGMNDAETMRILKDVIILCVHANPDGHDLVSEWYMREPVPEKRTMDSPPRLYQKYVGHDNNRDFYMSAMRESTNMNRLLFIEWFPQIMYNHHQTGPPGTIIFAPPFRDPFNYNFDPLIVTSLDLVGAAMHSRFIEEDKPGSTMRRGANYSTWYNGGLRTTTYFHNMIGLLTEIIGSPTPMEIPFLPNRLLPSADQPFPIAPQKWHYRQSIDYSITANRAVLDVAQRYRETFLYNIYKMGKNSIGRGNKDTWTFSPSKIDDVKKLIAKERVSTQESSPRLPQAQVASAPVKYFETLRKPEGRDPRGFILPANQADFPTAVKFVNALLKTGILIHKATAAFTVNGRNYPAGSYVVKTNQAFRPHVLDMFEPQDHPNDFQYEGGPPIAPYDNAGWTLAMQMGVKFDRILDGFDGPFQRLPDGVLEKPPAGRIEGSGAGYLISHKINDSFILTNRLLAAKEDVYWLKDGVKGQAMYGPGAIYVPGRASTKAIIEKAAAEFGFNAKAVATRPAGETLKLNPTRIALWDRFGGSMPSGWVRWLFEKFEFPFDVIYPQTLDSGNLRAKYDVIVFVGGAIPRPRTIGPETGRGAFASNEPKKEKIPDEFHAWMGGVTEDKSIPQLKRFLDSGGTVVTIGSSNYLASYLGVPLKDALVERSREGVERPLARDKYYIPGSVLEANVDVTQPVAYGLDEKVDVLFDNSPVFKLAPEAVASGVKPALWFGTAKPLRSGWAWGQQYLEGGVAVAEVPVGEGRLMMMGPEITFRAQPHGTFKLLFNSLLLGTATSGK